MKLQKRTNQKRDRRARRTRYHLKGTALRPRLSVFRSNAYTSAQLIDDDSGRTILSASTRPEKKSSPGKRTAAAMALGERLAAQAKDKGIVAVVFDRGSYRYHGRIRALADGLRKGGLNF